MVRRILISLAMMPLAAHAVGAPVDSSELARCHAMATRDQQLDCYEALAAAAASGAATALAAPPAPRTAAPTAPGVPSAPGPAASTASAIPSAPGPAAPTASAIPSAPGPAASTASAIPSAPGPAAPTASAVPSAPGVIPAPGAQPAAPFNPDDPANWGLSRRQADPHPSAPASPTAIKTTVFQLTEDRLHNVTVVLDNGQTWKFIDPEPRLRPGDSVTIKRASLGSFLMLTPSRRSYRVERSR